jgi:integrase
MRGSAIDFDRHTLTVERTIERTRAYGIRLIEAAKNESSVRTIGIDRTTCEVLRRHRAEQMELALKLGVPYPIDCLLFAHPVKRQPAGLFKRDVDFNRPVDPEEITKKFARGAATAGFVFTLHGLRHTHATQLLLDGVPIHVVAQRLGHSTPAITSEVYAHVIKRAEDRAVEAAGNMTRAALRL